MKKCLKFAKGSPEMLAVLTIFSPERRSIQLHCVVFLHAEPAASEDSISWGQANISKKKNTTET